MMSEFGTKAETLERLRPLLKYSRVLPQARFTVDQWLESPDACLARIAQELGRSGGKLIVRSSSLIEDSLTQSNAGRFDTVGGVDSARVDLLMQAIQTVVDSYGPEGRIGNQVFVQPQLEDVKMSGVVFTRDIDTLAPYYVVNYDEASSSTSAVTSGRSNKLKTVIIFRGHSSQRSDLKALIQAVREIESHLQSDCLDIEFAIISKGEVYTFQVRPLVRFENRLPDVSDIGHYLEKLRKKVQKINDPHPYLYGRRTLLGVMPDWNPAEMIGVKPRPLALSLYKELITDRTWAYQRDNYGYKNLRSYPLMMTLIGHPYIDVRVSFSSFIPKDVPDDLSERLCNYYLDRLEHMPAHHDKVEFEIILSCYFFNMEERLHEMEQNGFSKSDTEILKKSLLELTHNIIAPTGGVFRRDLKKIEELQIRQQKVMDSSLTTLEKIYWLAEDCCRWGTLPFAGLARAGFIAVQILKSLVKAGFMSQEELEDYLGSLNTVGKQMAQDRAQMDREKFLEKYGHLRPGTYDILSARYDEAYDMYFGDASAIPPPVPSYHFDGALLGKINEALKRAGLEIQAASLFQFLKAAIEGREHAKFVFTRSVSEVLRLIQRLASRYNLSADDASYLNVRTLIQLYATLDHRNLEDILREEINRNRQYYEVTKLMKLPSLIIHPEDVYEFELAEGSPNFITLSRVRAEVMPESRILTAPLVGKIVCIASADPGYDWIFTKGIAGLVTMYGGANSHMAIRAAELRIPSVIGSGEKNYWEWSRASVLEIDTANHQVRVIR